MGLLRRSGPVEADGAGNGAPPQRAETVVDVLAAEWAANPRRLAVATAAVTQAHPTPDDVLRRAAQLMLAQLDDYRERLRAAARRDNVEPEDYSVEHMLADIHSLTDDDFAAWMRDWLPPARQAAS